MPFGKGLLGAACKSNCLTTEYTDFDSEGRNSVAVPKSVGLPNKSKNCFWELLPPRRILP